MTDRTKQPPIIVPQSIKPINCDTFVSGNNVSIYKIDNPGYDVLRVSFVFHAGVSQQDSPFIASSTLNNIAEGSKNYTSKELADSIDQYGLIYDASIDLDYAVITICGLKRFIPQALDIVKELILHPIFPEKELKVYTNKKKQQIAVQRAKVAYVAQENLQKALYGEASPFGRIYDTKEFDNITSQQLSDFYNRCYTASNMFVVVSGDASLQDINTISSMVELIPQGVKNKDFVPEEQLCSNIHIEKEGAVQTAIKIGKVLFGKQHKDFIGMQVVAKALGGYFGSRLNANLREDKGYTYGIYSSMANSDNSGYFAISGEVIAEYTNESIEEVFNEINLMCAELMSDDELGMVKSVLIGEIMRVLDGPFGVADVVIENIQNKKENDYLVAMVNEIREITPERVMSLSKEYLQEGSMCIVTVGKR